MICVLNACPPVPLVTLSPETTGVNAVKVIETGSAALVFEELVAVTLKLKVPLAFGVPDITPVLEFNDKPRLVSAARPDVMA